MPTFCSLHLANFWFIRLYTLAGLCTLTSALPVLFLLFCSSIFYLWLVVISLFVNYLKNLKQESLLSDSLLGALPVEHSLSFFFF